MGAEHAVSALGRITAAIIAAIVVAVSLTAAPAAADHQSADWTGSLYGMDDGAVDFDAALDGSASYTNGSTAVSFEVDGRDLQRGHGYTVWLMVFNHPENCIGADAANGLRCGAADHFNPAAAFSLMYGSGAWANNDRVVFAGVRHANSILNTPPDVAVGRGLVNPAGAEVHLRIRDHGPAQDCCGDDQVTTLNGGCTGDTSMPVLGKGAQGDYACADVQATGS